MMSYSILKADLKKNRDDIVALLKRNFIDVPDERYRWIYEENPSGPASCWVAKKEDNVVGVTALFPRKILMDGTPLLAGIAGDFSVDKGHRSLGPALLLQKAAISECREGKFIILYGFPNKQSELVLLRAAYRILGDVLRMTKLLESYHQIKKVIDIPLITRMISKPVDLIMRSTPKEKYYNNSNQYSCEVLSFFDHRFDTLWEKASSRFSIIGERSSSYLNWRYNRSPHHDYSIFALIHKEDGSIFGYIVFHYDTEARTYIDDLLAIDMEETLEVLLSEFISFQRKEKINSISIRYTGANALVTKLKEFGFVLRGKEGRMVVYSSPDSPFLPSLLAKDNWFLLPGDNDT